MPELSVILPVYNSAAYLRPAVESVLAQTFADFELLLLDDGSTDDSSAICGSFTADPRVRVISRPNKGFAATLNEGLERASADLVARMDADDVCRADRFAKQVAFLREHDDVVLLGGGYTLTDDVGRRLRDFLPPTDDATLQKQLLSGRNPICHPLVIFRKQPVVDVGGFGDEYRPAEDLELWLRLGEVGKIACLPDILLDYRQHGGSMSALEQEDQIKNLRRACREACERRGVEVAFEGGVAWRPGGDTASQHAFACKYGWWALENDERATAAHYGRRAIRLRPLAAEGWKLLAKAGLGR